MNTKTVAAIKALADKRGWISPEIVLKAAEHPRSPLHDLFTWDNEIAGHNFRLGQARALLRQVEALEYEKVIEHSYHVPFYIRDPVSPGNEQGYRALTEVRKDPFQVRVAVNRELSVAAAHLRRAQNIAIDLGLAGAIGVMIEKIVGMQNRIDQDTSDREDAAA